MTLHATDPLSLVLQKLVEIQDGLNDLNHRVSTLEGGKPVTGKPKQRILKSIPKPSVPPFLGAMKNLDEASIPATDKLAFATGYQTAKLGNTPDSICMELGVSDYSAGYNVGLQVLNREVGTPKWDLSQRDC